MNRIEVIKRVGYPFRYLFGSGVGNNILVKRVFRWLSTHMLQKQKVIVDLGGVKFGMTIGGERGLNSLSAGLMFGTGYEVQMTEVFKSLVKEGMNVVDVGAHIGYYTMLASKAKKVWAFEPEPQNYSELKENVKLNNLQNVVIFEKAVGLNNGESALFVTDGLSGECSLVNISTLASKTIKVKVVSLDGVLQGERVDIIKIDVDGGEIGVLHGAKELIKNNPNMKVFAEISHGGLRALQYTVHDFWGVITSYFKYVYLIDEKAKILRKLAYDDLAEYMGDVEGANILCANTEIDIPFKGLVPLSVMSKYHRRIYKRIDVLCSLVKKDDLVLEVGCGTGINVVDTLKHLPIRITAIDKDKKSIEYAIAKNGNENVRFVVATGEDYATDEKFDVIICSHILEHLVEPELLLNNMRRLLKDDGLLYVGVPNGFGCFEIENLLPRIIYKTSWGRRIIDSIMKGERDSLNMESQHINFFTYMSVLKLLNRCGWKVERTINEEIIGGALTDRTLLKLKKLSGWNIQWVDRLPHQIVNGWILICEKA